MSGEARPGKQPPRPVDDVLEDLAAALEAARRELLVAADGTADVLRRMSREAGLAEIRTRVLASEELQDQLHTTLVRAADSAEVTVDRLRREADSLGVLVRHPQRARDHVAAAAEFLEEIDQSTAPDSGSASEAFADSDRLAHLEQLRQSLPLLTTAVDQVDRHLQDSQDGVRSALADLTAVSDDLTDRATRAQRAQPGLVGRMSRIDELVGHAYQQLRHARYSGEAGRQYVDAATGTAGAVRAAGTARATGQRQRTDQHHRGPPGAGPDRAPRPAAR